MATGLVPIVSNLACFKDYIQEGIDGYVFDHRSDLAVQNLAETFTKAIKDWENMIEISASLAQKLQSYSYDQIAKIYLDDFKTLSD